MTGVLARLFARATGQADSNLRPRAPARFEDTGTHATGFRPASEEVVVTSPVPPQAEPDEAQQIPANRAAARADTADSGVREADEDDTRSPTPRRNKRHSAPPPLLPADRTSPLDPPRVDSDTGDRRAAVRGPPADSTPHGERPDEPDAGSADIDEQPKFMPILPRRLSGLAGDDQRTIPRPDLADQAAFPGQARRTGIVPEAPEITIHIGRIELRSDSVSAKAKPERRAEREKSTTSLSDYLKGNRR